MDLDIASRLEAFPSAPAIVRQVFLLADDPHAHLAQAADIISKDPALAAKILRAANSKIYSGRRESKNLRQAVTTLGMNNATELVLTFAMARFYRKREAPGLNYARCWRRALLSAMTAREFGAHLVGHFAEQIFPAALLQDIGMLALDRADPLFYAGLSPNASHDEVCRYELARLGADHAQVGAMLLAGWHLPEPLYKAVKESHGIGIDATESSLGPLPLCVAVAGRLADAMLAEDCTAQTTLVWPQLQQLLGLESADFCSLVTTAIGMLPEMEQVYETPILNRPASHALMEQARATFAPRSSPAVERAPALKARADQLETGVRATEDQSRKDAPTEAYDHQQLDATLEMEFAVADRTSSPLSIIFIDLDHFKLINSRYGHAAGDEVLRSTARLIRASLRDADVAARYGAEEFVAVLPGTDSTGAVIAANRILKALRSAVLSLDASNITFTASLGSATLASTTPFARVSDLVLAAKRAVGRAKTAGCNCLVLHGQALKRGPSA